MYVLFFASSASVNVSTRARFRFVFYSHYRTPEWNLLSHEHEFAKFNRASIRDHDVVDACIAESVIKARDSVPESDDDDDGGSDGDGDDDGDDGDDDESVTEKLFDAVTPQLALTPEL